MSVTDNLTLKPRIITTTEKSVISQKSIELLTYRILEEEKSSRLYEDMSLYLNNEGYAGASSVWEKYSKEELTHAGWAKEYLLSLGIKPKLSTLPELKTEYNSLVNIVDISYKHEVDILNQCKELAAHAHSEMDFLLYDYALKYVREQLEELDKLQTWKDQIKSFGSDKIALRLLDTAMAESLG